MIETVPVTKKTVEYTLALLLNSQPQAGSGYEYKYVTSQSTFELVLKVLKVMEGWCISLKRRLFSLFSWKDFCDRWREMIPMSVILMYREISLHTIQSEKD